MAKSSNQKLKLLYIIDMLERESSEEHPISTKAFIDMLDSKGICAERKSIYDDINQLVEFGYDIIQVRSKVNGGYYLASRRFELAELKLLVDAVQSSKFITEKKSRELIRKLEELTSKHEASHLQRQVYVASRVKTENEGIYYNVDAIHRGIHDNVQISFTYLEWSVNKELVPRRQGQKYVVSPWALIWKDEYYYLAAYVDGVVKHFRVDKMGSVTLEKTPREGLKTFEQTDLAKYANQRLGMFGGNEETVTIRFPNHLIGVIIDHFGKDVAIRKIDEEQLQTRIQVVVSGQFFGWLAGLGKDVVVTSPEAVKVQYIKWLYDTLSSQRLP
ncbi:MAG: WYL domain-containing protein [Lachnospiraceae bacterium]|nr:WYL domain-containing protein [Lachnospiraceae bacterium]MBQ7360844.1 WYL domain-containing protein [Lachnospiraceae bacterium]